MSIRNLSILLICIMALFLSTPSWSIPTLWGVDEDDGELFSIDDYTTLGGFTSYGDLRYDDGGTLRKVGNHIEAFTLDSDGTAYMALNSGLGGFSESVLLSFNIHDAQTASHNIVSILGTIGIGFDNPGDNISGLSIDPVSGNLYALHRDDDGDVLDSLFVLDKSDGSVLSSIGILSGSGQDVRSGEDLEFDRLGNLFVTDNADDHLYQVDPLTGSILSMIDSDEKDGISTSVKIEGLAWDFENDRLIASDDKRNLFAQLSLSDGANSSFGKISGLTDVEGIDFLPSSVPEPGSMLMLGLGLLAMGRKPRRG